MIIKVVCSPPRSTVLFGFEFGQHPDHLLPATWSSQITQLLHDGLELPKTMCALDKAVGITCLLSEVVLDIPTLTVSCHFIDGSCEEWPLMPNGFINSLENIIEDVYEATIADEMELQLARERVLEKERKAKVAALPPAKVGRHKKQRSIFMTIASCVESIMTMTVPPRPPSRRPPTEPPSSSQSPRSQLSPTTLRRRARSTIVDTFRLYVLTELSQRFPQGGYYTWITRSMLRRVSAQMDELLHHQVPKSLHSSFGELEHFSATTISVPPLFSDDEDEDAVTDTDGSSVHTPSSSHFNISSVVVEPPRDARQQGESPPTTNFLLQYLCPADLHEYSDLLEHKTRLQSLLQIMERKVTFVDIEQQEFDAILEVRSRRKAWSSKALAGASVRDYGFAMPPRSSPLAQHSWTADDWEYCTEEVELKASHQPRNSPYLVPNRVGVPVQKRLFPVIEEDEGLVEGPQTVVELDELSYDSEFEYDLEGGMRCTEDEEDPRIGLRVELEVTPLPIRPRMRTSSMYRQRPDVETPFVSPAPLQSLAQSSILLQPLSYPAFQGKPTTVDIAPIYTESGVNISELQVTGYNQLEKYPHDEFTLSMDLPAKTRKQDRNILRNWHDTGKQDEDPSQDFPWSYSNLLQPAIPPCR